MSTPAPKELPLLASRRLTPTTRRAHVWAASYGVACEQRDNHCEFCTTLSCPTRTTFCKSLRGSDSFASSASLTRTAIPSSITNQIRRSRFSRIAGCTGEMQVAGGESKCGEQEHGLCLLPAGFYNTSLVLSIREFGPWPWPNDVTSSILHVRLGV